MIDSDIELVFDFEDDIHVAAVLDRVHAPLIIEDIKSRLPIDARAALMKGEMKITLGIKRGNVKPTKNVSRGDIDNLFATTDNGIIRDLAEKRTFWSKSSGDVIRKSLRLI